MLRKAAAVVGVVAVFGLGPATADPVCVNGVCRNVPGAYGDATVSLTGQVKVKGGLVGGPGLNHTGVESVEAKPDNIDVRPLFNGASMGRWGVSNDFGDSATRIYMGASGCFEYEYDSGYVGRCTNEPDDD